MIRKLGVGYVVVKTMKKFEVICRFLSSSSRSELKGSEWYEVSEFGPATRGMIVCLVLLPCSGCIQLLTIRGVFALDTVLLSLECALKESKSQLWRGLKSGEVRIQFVLVFR